MPMCVRIHEMNEEDFVLQFWQICLRTNSYADPNQDYNANLNNLENLRSLDVHSFIHTLRV